MENIKVLPYPMCRIEWIAFLFLFLHMVTVAEEIFYYPVWLANLYIKSISLLDLIVVLSLIIHRDFLVI